MQSVAETQPAWRGLSSGLGILVVAAVVAAGSAVFGPLMVLPIFGAIFVAVVVTRPEYGIALFLSTFLMTYPTALQGAGFLTVNNALGGIFVVLLAYKMYREDDWWFLRCPELQLLGVVLVTFYLSGHFNAPDQHLVSLLGVQEFGAENLRTVTTRVAFTLFFLNYIRAPQHVRMIYLLAIAFMVITALTGIQGVLAGGGLHGYRAVTQGGAIASAANPNRLAMFAILAIAGLWHLMQWMRVPMLRVLLIPALCVLALAVFMTASRSGLLGLAVCMGVIVIDEGINFRQILTMLFAAVLVLSLVLRFVPDKSLERITNLPGLSGSDTGAGSGSLERRGYTWGIAWNLFREHPLIGVGAGNWELARFMTDPERITTAPHNSYLLAAVEGGIFCLFAFLGLIWRTWRNFRVSEEYLRDPDFPLADLMWVVKGARTSLVVLVFFSMFADLWQLVFLFWLVGLSVVIRRMVEQTALEIASMGEALAV